MKTAEDKNTKTRELGNQFLPFFAQNAECPAQSLIPVITLSRDSEKVVMLAYMNRLALKTTLETKEMHYWSRSRNALWHKGATSGQIQKLIEMKVDCDQDCLLAIVDIEGDGGCCHLGEKSCFHRSLIIDDDIADKALSAIKLHKDQDC